MASAYLLHTIFGRLRVLAIAGVEWASCAAEDILDDAADDNKDHDKESVATSVTNNDPTLGSLQQSGGEQGTNGTVVSEADSSTSRLSESAAAKSR